MYIPALIRSLSLCKMVLVCSTKFSEGQDPSDQGAHNRQKLQFVAFLSRHGVRSPTKEPSQFDPHSAVQWPQYQAAISQSSFSTSHHC